MRAKRSLGIGALTLTTLLAGCVNFTHQRWPGPMKDVVTPLPPGDSQLHPPGPEEVTVVRHADPVRVRPSASNSARPLSFHDKQARMSAGGQVVVAPGGRAEVLWPEGGSVILFGRAVGWIGSPSRGEPMFDLRDVERARVQLREEDQIRLVGGALLAGAGGPYLLTTDAGGTLAVHNQSKGGMTVAFRDEVFEMGPGQRVVLPLLSDGGTPYELPEETRRLAGPGFNLDVVGEVEPLAQGDGVLVTASGPGEVHGLGVVVRMAPGTRVTFSDVGGVSEESPAAQAPAEVPAEPEPAPDPSPEEADPEPVEPAEDSEGG